MVRYLEGEVPLLAPNGFGGEKNWVAVAAMLVLVGKRMGWWWCIVEINLGMLGFEIWE